jgi:transcriptional regulator with XRE-family HTH domain
MSIINEEFYKSVGKRLFKLREAIGFTQKRVVEKLESDYYLTIDEKTLRRYEKGESLPKIDNLICLAELYNTTLDYIVYGKDTSDDNSFAWYDNFKRLNRLMYTMQIKLLRDKDRPTDVYLQLLDTEAKEWFGRMERFIENRRLMFNNKGLEKSIDIKELDELIEDFQTDRIQLCPIEERYRRTFLTIQPFATSIFKEENGELVITTKIHKKQS